jgi:hypothetical protein
MQASRINLGSRLQCLYLDLSRLFSVFLGFRCFPGRVNALVLMRALGLLMVCQMSQTLSSMTQWFDLLAA